MDGLELIYRFICESVVERVGGTEDRGSVEVK